MGVGVAESNATSVLAARVRASSVGASIVVATGYPRLAGVAVTERVRLVAVALRVLVMVWNGEVGVGVLVRVGVDVLKKKVAVRVEVRV